MGSVMYENIQFLFLIFHVIFCRFLHYLDSIGMIIDDPIKEKLATYSFGCFST